MRRLVIGPAVGIALIGSAPAATATPVVSKRLGQVYGVAWRKHTPTTATPGESVTIGGFSCQVSATGVQCMTGAKGFTITPQQVTPVG